MLIAESQVAIQYWISKNDSDDLIFTVIHFLTFCDLLKHTLTSLTRFVSPHNNKHNTPHSNLTGAVLHVFMDIV